MLVSASYEVMETLLTLTFNDSIDPALTCFDKIDMEIGESGDLDFGLPMAAVTLLALPTMILFLALQRYFISGIRTTGLKGAA